jgi:hypothetical protein
MVKVLTPPAKFITNSCRKNAFNYDKGVLAEILQPIMGKGLMPPDISADISVAISCKNAFNYDKGVLAEILEPIMRKGIPADLDTFSAPPPAAP